MHGQWEEQELALQRQGFMSRGISVISKCTCVISAQQVMYSLRVNASQHEFREGLAPTCRGLARVLQGRHQVREASSTVRDSLSSFRIVSSSSSVSISTTSPGCIFGATSCSTLDGLRRMRYTKAGVSAEHPAHSTQNESLGSVV